MLKQPKIWVIPGQYPDPSVGKPGANIFIHRQTRELNKLAAELEVLLVEEWIPPWPLKLLKNYWKENVNSPKVRYLDGVKIVSIQYVRPTPSRLFGLTGSQLRVRAIKNYLLKQNANIHDVVFAHWLIPDGWIALQAARQAGALIAIEMRGDDIFIDPYRSEIHRSHAVKALEQSDLILGCCPAMIKSAFKFTTKIKKTGFVYNGIVPEKVSKNETKIGLRQELKLPENEFLIICIASLNERKGWIEFLQALKQLKQEQHYFKVLAIYNNQQFSLNKLLESLGLCERVINIGEVEPDKIGKFLRASDCFCLPSRSEGLPNALIEAMANGLACVATRVGGIPDILHHNKNGLVVSPESPGELAEALKELICSDHKVKFYGKKAIETIREVGTFESNAEKLFKMLQSLSNSAVTKDVY